LVDGILKGDSIPALAARIQGVFTQASRTRAEVIARTEVLSAYNGATYQSSQLLGSDVIAGRKWLATEDARTRRTHREADGQVRIGEAPFSVGSSSMRYPGDPEAPAHEIIQCRCTMLLLTPEEIS
jgi:SPP1 gp7 family putative phage head morphogenesis protein